MKVWRQDMFLLVILAAAISPSFGQVVAPNASLPDFSGVWHRWLRPGLGPPASGHGPVTNRARVNGVSNYNRLVGDYTNPILKPEAAEIVKKHGELSLAGVGYPTPSNQCWPGGVPYIFWNFGNADAAAARQDHACSISRITKSATSA